MLRGVATDCSFGLGSIQLANTHRSVYSPARSSSFSQPRRQVQRSPRAALSTGPLAPPRGGKPIGSKNDSTHAIFNKIAACVEANDSVHRFETIAGRSAMIGFAVACSLEVVLPHGSGIFSGADLSAFSGLAIVAVCASVMLASLTKHRIGGKFREAVVTSLTALSRSGSSLSALDVDSAVDFVFASVFNRDLVSRMFVEDEWI